jgi:hypothetical protein
MTTGRINQVATRKAFDIHSKTCGQPAGAVGREASLRPEPTLPAGGRSVGTDGWTHAPSAPLCCERVLAARRRACRLVDGSRAERLARVNAGRRSGAVIDGTCSHPRGATLICVGTRPRTRGDRDRPSLWIGMDAGRDTRRAPWREQNTGWRCCPRERGARRAGGPPREVSARPVGGIPRGSARWPVSPDRGLGGEGRPRVWGGPSADRGRAWWRARTGQATEWAGWLCRAASRRASSSPRG